jgi:hypothetical protein
LQVTARQPMCLPMASSRSMARRWVSHVAL